MITTTTHAITILDDDQAGSFEREAALRYLAKYPTPKVVTRLVLALQDNDAGVRWVAASVLEQLGEIATLEVLKALTDPDRVGDPFLRNGAFHILHHNQLLHPGSFTELLKALKGQAAEITSLVEADRVLREIEKRRLVKTQLAQTSLKAGTARRNNLSRRYEQAQLQGRLSRLRSR